MIGIQCIGRRRSLTVERDYATRRLVHSLLFIIPETQSEHRSLETAAAAAKVSQYGLIVVVQIEISSPLGVLDLTDILLVNSEQNFVHDILEEDTRPLYTNERFSPQMTPPAANNARGQGGEKYPQGVPQDQSADEIGQRKASLTQLAAPTHPASDVSQLISAFDTGSIHGNARRQSHDGSSAERSLPSHEDADGSLSFRSDAGPLDHEGRDQSWSIDRDGSEHSEEQEGHHGEFQGHRIQASISPNGIGLEREPLGSDGELPGLPAGEHTDVHT